MKLWRSEADNFPTVLYLGEEEIPINTDFRCILRILQLDSDESVSPLRKYTLLLKWFLTPTTSCPNITTITPEILTSAISKFIVPPRADDDVNDPIKSKLKEVKKDKPKKPQYCFEFDAIEIFTSFLMDYNIDLTLPETKMHWYKFLYLLQNLSEGTPFSRKIELRTRDLSDFKGKAKTKMAAAQKKVQLPEKYSQNERAMVNDLLDVLYADVE